MQKCSTLNLSFDVLHDFAPFVQFEKRENTHGGVLLLVTLQAKAGTKSHNASHLQCISKMLHLLKYISTLHQVSLLLIFFGLSYSVAKLSGTKSQNKGEYDACICVSGGKKCYFFGKFWVNIIWVIPNLKTNYKIET